MRLRHRLMWMLALLCAGCTTPRPLKIPMDTHTDLAPETDAPHILLIMLPGVRDMPGDFVSQGFIAELRARRLPVDVIAVDAHMGYYLDRSVVTRLERDIIVPAMQRRKYGQLWFAGVSLGGMGSILYAHDRPDQVTGMIVLAPFLGSAGIVSEIEAAGGLDQWEPGPIDRDDASRMAQAWIKQYRPGDRAAPAIYLGYGENDRFAAANRLLASRLPAAQTVAIPGGHDWGVWKALWVALLEQDPFGQAPTQAQVTDGDPNPL